MLTPRSARQPCETLRVEHFHCEHARHVFRHLLKVMSAVITDHTGDGKDHFVSFHFTTRIP